MFGIGMPHLLLLAAIALIAIGPKQLPEVARVIGRFLNDLKKVRDEFTRTIVESRDNVNQNLYDQNQTHDQTLHQQDYGTHSAQQASSSLSIEPHVAPHDPQVAVNSFDANHPHHTGYDAGSTHEPAVDEKDQLAFDLNKKDS